MFRWLFLNETALTPAEHTAWKLSALRLILVSSFVLEGWIALHSSVAAWERGVYRVLWIVGLFYSLKILAIYFSDRYLKIAASLLIANIYFVAFAIATLTQNPELANLGLVFVYTAPVIARLFFGSKLALSLMLLNTLPFAYLISDIPAPDMLSYPMDLPEAGIYIHTLLFLFFNFCLPLAIFRLLHALDVMLIQFRETSGALQVSYTQYQEIFENAGTALLLTDASGQILQANHKANTLLGRNPEIDDELALFGWLSIDDSVRLKGNEGEVSSSLRMSAYRTRDGKMVALDNISQTFSDHYIVALRDVSGLHKIHDELQLSLEREDYLSSHDALTNLPNREMLRQYLHRLLENKERNNVSALISFRLNSIRHANQQFGAYTGDVLLRRFADELSQALPKNCFCARLRSIVFSFVVDHLQAPGEIIQFVDQLRQVLPKELEVNGETLLVQFSAGIALVRPEDSDPDDLMRRSEVALDTSRRSSDQSVTMFDEEDAQQIRRSVEIEVGIVNGLKLKEFELWYQPKVDHDGRIAGVEALLRWTSASLGRVSPTEFVPIAERSGLIRHISDFVLEQVCAQIRVWLNEFGHSPVVALNLSVSDIGRRDLISLIDECCQRYSIDAKYLEFEITETGLIANEMQSIQHLNVLKNRGFGIAIDDFGTGYSSLSKLSHFPAHTVKIDRSFVAQIGYNRKSEMIIKAIISLAKILSCSTVAEGVETENQELFLKEIGCEFFQGFYYHRPMHVDNMRVLLRQAYLGASCPESI
jgi:diguanylate cyclase (GGDEF)-like protein